jgi:hypothetical protein
MARCIGCFVTALEAVDRLGNAPRAAAETVATV